MSVNDPVEDLVLHLKPVQIQDTGLIGVERIYTSGAREDGQMRLPELINLMRGLYNHMIQRVPVKLMTVEDFQHGGFHAFGQIDTKWKALVKLPPAERTVISAAGVTYRIKFPWLVAMVGNYDWPSLWWTPDSSVSNDTVIFPLMIGNVYASGRVCMGSYKYTLTKPDMAEIEQYVQAVIAARTTNENIEGYNSDQLFREMEESGWNPVIGSRHRTSVREVLARKETW